MKLKKTKYVIKCHSCKGTGETKTKGSMQPLGYEIITVNCPTCNGKGTLPVFEEEG